MGRIATDWKLNEKILVDLKAGVKWAEIREKHGVDNPYINSVQGIYQAEINHHKGHETGVVHLYKGNRVDDEKPSPIKTFNISDLTDEELERMGLMKYKKKA